MIQTMRREGKGANWVESSIWIHSCTSCDWSVNWTLKPTGVASKQEAYWTNEKYKEVIDFIHIVCMHGRNTNVDHNWFVSDCDCKHLPDAIPSQINTFKLVPYYILSRTQKEKFEFLENVVSTYISSSELQVGEHRHHDNKDEQ